MPKPESEVILRGKIPLLFCHLFRVTSAEVLIICPDVSPIKMRIDNEKKHASNFILQYDDKTKIISQKRLKCGFYSIHFRYSFTKRESKQIPREPICPPLDFLQRVIDIKRGFHPVELLRHGTSDQRRVDFLIFLRSCGPKHKKN